MEILISPELSPWYLPPPALQKLSANYPTLNIYSAMIDEQINDNGFIVPGLGDAGDRAFGTE